ncbi:hypothetical protein I312_101649 [Cryptococcus bacillisporus CA1280]|uniref:uncharacterized protein n=1 Tax=Cryptococcus bacillisporus CA1280 TaxID=1296109 RepID=UPI0033685319
MVDDNCVEDDPCFAFRWSSKLSIYRCLISPVYLPAYTMSASYSCIARDLALSVLFFFAISLASLEAFNELFSISLEDTTFNEWKDCEIRCSGGTAPIAPPRALTTNIGQVPVVDFLLVAVSSALSLPAIKGSKPRLSATYDAPAVVSWQSISLLNGDSAFTQKKRSIPDV